MYKALLTPKRNFKTKVLYLTGLQGTEKSSMAAEVAELVTQDSVYYKSEGKWWDYYENQDTVIWDDFRGCDYKLSELLKLLDRYPYKVEFKGGMVEFNSKCVIITSNKDWKDLYEKGGEPIRTRIDFLLHVSEHINDTPVRYKIGYYNEPPYGDWNEETWDAKTVVEHLFNI